MTTRPDIDETIRRLKAYADAGADCVYAPRLERHDHVSAVVDGVAPTPVNLLINAPFITVADAARLGVGPGDAVRLTTRRASVIAVADVDDSMQPGHLALPNGLGLDHPGADGAAVVTGVAPNELTSSEDRDWLAGTPWHKHVPARVEALTTVVA